MRRGIVIAIGVLYAALTPFPAGAQQDRTVQQRSGSDQPVVFKADRIRHDKELGIVVASFGCVGGEYTAPSIGQGDGRLTIEVVNHGFEELTIHALWLGQTRRLGNVGGTRTVEFILPWSWTDELQIRIAVLAGSECLTRPIFASPGDHIFLEVQQFLRYCDL